VSRRCQHDPRNPRLTLKCAVPANLPELNRLAFAACARIVLERNKFPELGNGRGQRRFLFTSPHRERRSQRLEAIVLVARCIFLHMDVLSLRSGKTLRDGSCDAVDVAQMMKDTGLTFPRTARARRDLISAGFLTWHQPIKKYCTCDVVGCEGAPKGLCHNGGERKHRAFPAILTVTMSFFKRLGLTVDEVKWLQRGTQEKRKSFPRPIVDITLQRDRRRAIRAQQHAGAVAERAATASRMVIASAARVAKLYGRKNE
jgi:hypothetical protein